ncbi:MAG TPA: hypothetical protein VMD74_00220 [Candidatus Methylomirabilis sp.]|nr:hypothetical protein [Candidatus Methylomirabilis sp.]
MAGANLHHKIRNLASYPLPASSAFGRERVRARRSGGDVAETTRAFKIPLLIIIPSCQRRGLGWWEGWFTVLFIHLAIT